MKKKLLVDWHVPAFVAAQIFHGVNKPRRKLGCPCCDDRAIFATLIYLARIGGQRIDLPQVDCPRAL